MILCLCYNGECINKIVSFNFCFPLTLTRNLNLRIVLKSIHLLQLWKLIHLEPRVNINHFSIIGGLNIFVVEDTVYSDNTVCQINLQGPPYIYLGITAIPKIKIHSNIK